MIYSSRAARRAAILMALATALTGVSGAACRNESRDTARPSLGRDEAAGRRGAAIKIVALGDSLTAGYGLPTEQAYPSLIEARLRAAGINAVVVNAGVSGDTSAGGRRRIEWALDADVRVLVVALGGNDALRGLPVEQLRDNLAAIIERARQANVSVILAGMEAPPNLGPAYTRAFRQVYTDLARKYDVPLLPFLLDGVAGRADLNLPDGIHPNAAGAAIVADNLWPFIEKAVRTVSP